RACNQRGGCDGFPTLVQRPPATSSTGPCAAPTDTSGGGAGDRAGGGSYPPPRSSRWRGSQSTSWRRDQICESCKVPALQNTFRRLYLNQWTEQSERWIDMTAWNDCTGQIDW